MKARIKPKDIFSKQTRKAVNQYVLEEVDRTKKEELKKVALVENEYGFMINVPPNKIQFVDTQEQLKKIENCLKERNNNA